MPEQEVWKSSIPGLVAVLKIDRRGEVVHEVVQPGQKVSVSVEERVLNQDRAASSDLDPFMNGILTPIRLIEGSENSAEIASNPNLISEEDMRKLFGQHWKQFQGRVNEITNVTTLSRLLAMTDEVDATVKQVQVIKDRIAEVQPNSFVEVSTVNSSPQDVEPRGNRGVSSTGERVPKAVTPK